MLGDPAATQSLTSGLMLKAWEQPIPSSHRSSISASYLPTSGRVHLKWMREPHSDANGGKSNMTAFAFCIQFSCFFLKGKNTKGKGLKKKKKTLWITLLLKCFTSAVARGQEGRVLCIFMSRRWPLYGAVWNWREDLHAKSSDFLFLTMLSAEGNPLREGPASPCPIEVPQGSTSPVNTKLETIEPLRSEKASTIVESNCLPGSRECSEVGEELWETYGHRTA